MIFMIAVLSLSNHRVVAQSEVTETKEEVSAKEKEVMVAKAFQDKLGNPATVTESENKLGLFIRNVTKTGNGYIVDYDTKNTPIAKNGAFIMSKVFFIDPENYSNNYQPFTLENGKMNFSYDEGDEITLPIRRIKFEPSSKIMYMYFSGIEKSVSEEFYTVPLFFTIILGDNPSVFEEIPRLANDLFDKETKTTLQNK